MKRHDAAHSRYLKKLARETDRARLVRARAAVKEARAAKKTARQRARAACAAARAFFIKWLAEERAAVKTRIAELRAKLKADTAAQRAKVQACCGRHERERVRAASNAAIEKARAELAELLSARKRERTWKRSNVKLSALPKGGRAKERSQESDHSVEVNLTPDQAIVWHKVKAKISGNDRMSRTEAFQHWLHEHSADVGRILVEDADAAYKRAVRDEKQERARSRSDRSDAQLASYIAAELGHTVRPPSIAPPPSQNEARTVLAKLRKPVELHDPEADTNTSWDPRSETGHFALSKDSYRLFGNEGALYLETKDGKVKNAHKLGSLQLLTLERIPAKALEQLEKRQARTVGLKPGKLPTLTLEAGTENWAVLIDAPLKLGGFHTVLSSMRGERSELRAIEKGLGDLAERGYLGPADVIDERGRRARAHTAKPHASLTFKQGPKRGAPKRGRGADVPF